MGEPRNRRNFGNTYVPPNNRVELGNGQAGKNLYELEGEEHWMYTRQYETATEVGLLFSNELK